MAGIPFEEHLFRVASAVQGLEPDPVDVDLSPVYAEPDEEVRASRRQCLDDARVRMGAQLDLLNYIAATIQSVQQEIRQRYSRTINAKAPIDVLPPEILGDILTYAVAQAGCTRLGALEVAQVSSHWRRVALQLSSLWSKIVVHERLPRIATRDYDAFIAEWVRRSGDAPLDIMIQAQYLGLLKKLEISALRIRSLTIIDWKKRTGFLTPYSDHPDYVKNMALPSLEILRLLDRHFLGSIPKGLETCDLPKLHTLVIVGPCIVFLPQLLTAHGAQLRSLTIVEDFLPREFMERIDQHCTSLETLRLRGYESSFQFERDPGSVPNGGLEMKTLVRLETFHCTPEMVMVLDRYCRFPNLRSFTIIVRGADNNAERLEVFRDFLAGIVRNEQNTNAYMMDTDHKTIFQIQRCAFLEELVIDGNPETVCEFLKALYSLSAKQPFDTFISQLDAPVPSIFPSSLKTLSLLAFGIPRDPPIIDFMHHFLALILEPFPTQLSITSSEALIDDSPAEGQTQEAPKYRCCIDDSSRGLPTVILPCLITHKDFLTHHLAWYEQRVGKIEEPDFWTLDLGLEYEGVNFLTQYGHY
jgi:F-box-like